jgi:hypothetical protein
MGLLKGDITASSGMSKAIYQEVDTLLSPPLQQAVDGAEGDAKEKAQEALDKSREGWRKLSYAIAQGVIEHIKANMEIYGVQTQGDINTTVSGETDTSLSSPNDHGHGLINSSGEQNNVVFTQSNDGTGHVE